MSSQRLDTVRLQDDDMLHESLRHEIAAASAEEPTAADSARILRGVLPAMAALSAAGAATQAAASTVAPAGATKIAGALGTSAWWMKGALLVKSVPVMIAVSVATAGVGTTLWIAEHPRQKSTAPTVRASRHAEHSHEPAASRKLKTHAEPAAVASQRSLPSPVAKAIQQDAVPEPEARRGIPTFRRRPPAASKNHIGAENQASSYDLLHAAQQRLRSDPAASLRLTQIHMERFPGDPLAQERDRIAIEALVRMGDLKQAQARARAFEISFPHSVHLTRIRELVSPQRGMGDK